MGFTPTQEAKAKREAFIGMLNQGMTMLHLDARAEEVDVPERFRRDHHLRLNFSYRFQLSKFIVEDDAVTASLSFSGETYLCVIPWSAVFGMTSHVTGETRAWAEHMPPELLRQAEVLAGGIRHEETMDDDDDIVGGAVRRVGHMRVIK